MSTEPKKMGRPKNKVPTRTFVRRVTEEQYKILELAVESWRNKKSDTIPEPLRLTLEDRIQLLENQMNQLFSNTP